MEIETPNLLVIRHEKCSSLGLLEAALKPHSVPFKYLDIAQNETLLEPIAHYSHIVVLGGAISAYEHQQYPFLYDEFKLLETAIAQGIPTLGICLGSQILATVLGAKVYRGQAGREAGWCDVQLTEQAAIDPLLDRFPQAFKVFQSHQDTFDLPSGCVHLAKNEKYTNQAFRYQNHVWAIQFHLEIDEHVLEDCSAVIEQELKDSEIQHTNLTQLLNEARFHSPSVAPLANQFMHQFLWRQEGKVLSAEC
ncbi:MAG: type 1 glutamine amidotransferase [Stenomitos rutilans HA7619-LM2]|jgi:GMP synthase-like glutamine amidotransferase|nr:type 1 glutamine amidotransferase [Stenomitos rutilans HA7619-LM2]